MKKQAFLRQITPLFLLALLGLSACLPFGNAESEVDIEKIHTSAAQTVAAQLTMQVGETAIAQLTQMAAVTTATPTLVPASETPLPTVTATNTSWPPTDTPTPTFTSAPPTATRIPPTATTYVPPCNWAQFVMDVTVPDGSVMPPGSRFTKVWRIRNIGSCTWTQSYSLIFVGGAQLSTNKFAPLPGVVSPGQVVDLLIEMQAPATPGRYRSEWMLNDNQGRNFGIGDRANKAFWVDIQVINANTQYPFDFAANMCAAVWRSGASSLPCPGDQNSAAGSVVLLNQPVLETGKREDEPTLWTRPNLITDGWIMGVYPSYKVQPGDHFMSDIGCLDDSKGCDVSFHLSYQIAGQPVVNLGSWRETYDGKLTRVDIDLSALAGQHVQFILSVTNNGRPAKANAFWLVPAIRRVSPTPTPKPENSNAVKAARLAVAQGLGVDPNQIQVIRVVSVQWTDTCLETNPPGEVCSAAIIPGYRILLAYGARQFEARTDLLGDIVYWFER